MEVLHSRIIGEGKPLCILHGFLGMSDNWKTLGNKYANEGFEVHLIDQRNHGKSFHDPNFNYDILALDLVHYLRHHRLDKISLIGHSMGGKTAMQMACSQPELVERLLVADIAPKYYPPHHNAIIDALNGLSTEALQSRKGAERALAEDITDVGTRQFLLKNLYWITKEQLGFRCNLAVLSTKMEEIGENISATALYNGPTLFLKGDRSEYVVEADYPEIKRHFPKAIIQTITNAGHWLHAENPLQFFEKSLIFMNS